MIPGDKRQLGQGWWGWHWPHVKAAVRYYVHGEGQAELKGIIVEKYIRQAHTDLAVNMMWLPTSPLVQTTLHEAKRARTLAEPKQVPPPLLGR